MNRIKILLVLILLLLSAIAEAQQYQISGYAGADTLHLGIAQVDKKGNLVIDASKLMGAIRLTPVNNTYYQLLLHFEQFKTIQTKKQAEAAQAYVKDSLDFKSLYHSPLWKEYIQYWIGFYAQNSPTPNDFATRFVPVAKETLSRVMTQDKKTGIHLVSSLIEIFEQFALVNAAASIAAYTEGIDVEADEQSVLALRLLAVGKLVGKEAPAIADTDGKQIAPKSTIVLFYETGCGSCDHETEEAIRKYQIIKSKGLDVISITSDLNKETYKKRAKDFPWTNKIFDGKGFNGNNFVNYGLISTPTLYLIDKEGKLQGRYTSLFDLLNEAK